MLYEGIFWLMAALGSISLAYPWSPRLPGAKWLVHLPLLLFPLLVAYEMAMPSRMNIRLDIPLIAFALMIVGGVYLLRLVIFYMRRGQPPEDMAGQ